MNYIEKRRQTVVAFLKKGVSERIQKNIPACSKEGINQGGACLGSF